MIMHVSNNAINIIIKYKLCYLSNTIKKGISFIGYEHVNENNIKYLDNVNVAKVILRYDLDVYETYLNLAINNGFFNFTLNQNQFDALISIIESTGTECLYKLVKDKSPDEISNEILNIRIPNMSIENFVKRRFDEYLLFTGNIDKMEYT